jgi:inner membrane protein
MDSLSQIVLGSAVGEAVLGRKIGNRAMVVGAIAGTIPDLDVLANPFLDHIQSLDFHRGISHSIAFSVVAPFLFAGITHWFFKNDHQHNKWYRGTLSVLGLLGLLITSGLIAYAAFAEQAMVWGIVTIVVGLLLCLPIIRWWRRKPGPPRDASYVNWYWLFFWVFLTHILLDVFTTYGTQVFMPFSNYRLAFSTIAVVDPLYTLPFLGCLLFAATMRCNSLPRFYTNLAGIIISSLYLLFTVYNKTMVNEILTQSLKAKGIQCERQTTSPSMFNNILWSGTAEADSVYYIGTYSKFDPERRIQRFTVIPKNHHLLEEHNGDPHIMTLKRFSNGFYTIVPATDSTKMEFIDLRWGVLDDMAKVGRENSFPIKFELYKNEKGRLEAIEKRPSVEKRQFFFSQRVLTSYWERIMGKWR